MNESKRDEIQGEMTDKEYAPVLAKRKAWRQRINELEKQLEYGE